MPENKAFKSVQKAPRYETGGLENDQTGSQPTNSSPISYGSLVISPSLSPCMGTCLGLAF